MSDPREIAAHQVQSITGIAAGAIGACVTMAQMRPESTASCLEAAEAKISLSSPSDELEPLTKAALLLGFSAIVIESKNAVLSSLLPGYTLFLVPKEHREWVYAKVRDEFTEVRALILQQLEKMVAAIGSGE